MNHALEQEVVAKYPHTIELIDELSLVAASNWVAWDSRRNAVIRFIESEVDWSIPRGKILATRRKARLAWLSLVLQRPVTTTKELNGQELYTLYQWVTGWNQIGNRPVGDAQGHGCCDTGLADERLSELWTWLCEHQSEFSV